jgi:hypothetical protein
MGKRVYASGSLTWPGGPIGAAIVDGKLIIRDGLSRSEARHALTWGAVQLRSLREGKSLSALNVGTGNVEPTRRWGAKWENDPVLVKDRVDVSKWEIE